MRWSNKCVVDVCGRWLNIVEFHEVCLENKGNSCVMDEGIRMGISFPFIGHILCPEVFCFWVLEVGFVNDEDCSENVGFLFWHSV